MKIWPYYVLGEKNTTLQSKQFHIVLKLPWPSEFYAIQFIGYIL